jgi:transposase, IS6 family
MEARTRELRRSPPGFRWVQPYAPELDQRWRPHLAKTNDSYRVAATYSKMTKQGDDLYRAVAAAGQPIDCLLRAPRDATAAERFFRQALQAKPPVPPRVITVAQPAPSPPAFATLPPAGPLPPSGTFRPGPDVNNVVAQDHRLRTRRLHPG